MCAYICVCAWYSEIGGFDVAAKDDIGRLGETGFVGLGCATTCNTALHYAAVRGYYAHHDAYSEG